MYFGFSAWITNLLTKRFAFDLRESTSYQALLPISVMIGIPLWSSLALKIGRKMTLMFFGYILAMICFVSMYLMPLRKTIIVSVPLFFLGQFLAIQSSCTWSSVCLATPAEGTALALGLVQFGTASIGALLAELFSKILEDQKHEEFDTALLIMAGFSLIGCGISVIGYKEDQRIGGLLERPENGLRVQAIKRLIDREELYDIIEEIEERNKDRPNKKELC